MERTYEFVETSRLKVAYLAKRGLGERVVLFVHGNLSTSLFWKSTMEELPESVDSYAVDLRGFGKTEPLAIDATEGVNGFARDLKSFIHALEIPAPIHFVGWSVGGGVVMQYAINHPEEVASLTLLSTMSPYGFGGTRGANGESCWLDYAGSGGGTVNQEFVKSLKEKDRTSSSDASPRRIMNGFFFKPPFTLDVNVEEQLLEAILETSVGDEHYPGTMVESPNWPGVAPGELGINNAISPKYTNLKAFSKIEPKPPVLWIRGTDDQVVSDTSLFDLGYLGQLGAIPGWPGLDVFPPQPMVTQIRSLLEEYRECGGEFEEIIVEDCGHSPHLEKPEEFKHSFYPFLERV